MRAKDLRERSQEDLKELEKSLAKDTFTVRFKNFTNRLDDTSTINKTKRDLARVKTLLRQAELNAATTATAAGEKPATAKGKLSMKAAAASKKKTPTKTTARAKKKPAAAKGEK
jgi:large subunit ribosomal protein L29